MTQPVDEWVFLAGRPPLQEYLGFIAAQTSDETTVDLGALVRAWGEANDRVQDLQAAEAGVADGPKIEDMPAELAELAADAITSAVIQKTFNAVPTTIAMIDLDTLVVFQKAINLRYAAELRTAIEADMSPSVIFQLCVGTPDSVPTPSITRANQNTWIAVSPSSDLRFLGPALLSPEAVAGYPPIGFPTAVLALGVGYGANVLNAIAVGNRLVLNNGSHRAYALYEAGLRRVPAVIQSVSRPDELQVVAPGELGQTPERYLGEPRPPLLRDYFDPRLRTIVPVPRKNRQVRLTFAFEQIDVPAG
jgi:hypothetical protein